MFDQPIVELMGGPKDGLMLEVFDGSVRIAFPTLIGGEHVYQIIPNSSRAEYAGFTPFAKEQHHDE